MSYELWTFVQLKFGNASLAIICDWLNVSAPLSISLSCRFESNYNEIRKRNLSSPEVAIKAEDNDQRSL